MARAVPLVALHSQSENCQWLFEEEKQEKELFTQEKNNICQGQFIKEYHFQMTPLYRVIKMILKIKQNPCRQIEDFFCEGRLSGT